MEINKKWKRPVVGGLRAGAAGMCAAAALTVGLAFGLSWERQGAPAQAALTKAAQAPATPLARLPIEPLEGESSKALARRLVDKDTFFALALSVEDTPPRAYVDRAGANAGAGYCVDARRKALGDDAVRSDLQSAGFSLESIAHLMSKDPKRIESVEVDARQALRLLTITKPQYESMARAAMGAEAFEKLPKHRQDVLSYISYNTGGPEKFVNLLDAIKRRDDAAALSEMAPKFRWGSTKSGKPKFKLNHRLRAWAQVAWMGPGELTKAIEEPVHFERSYAGSSGQDKFIKQHMAFFDKQGARKATQSRKDQGATRESKPAAGSSKRAVAQAKRAARVDVSKLAKRVAHGKAKAAKPARIDLSKLAKRAPHGKAAQPAARIDPTKLAARVAQGKAQKAKLAAREAPKSKKGPNGRA
jgi:hypothetical protein